ncbi:SDR family NAD(P)-dependent oxidoreductase [Nocardia brasiliensis]|uniref:SDR family NAD(P)-dependent oxidoreductase n=1 Tax=Nocardia brasiliensis TaxID=37326 RepID=A0A6G9XJK1_NOCBR|nr:SDR family oxidoreductase [Nocardia brasiliensis]QIS01092.1 SDR family NAD(P)-dependent oxidoreductase [Nocardia brasiliensis]
MSETIAIFGAGPGLGMGTARRFGRAGFRVAVIGRDPDRARRHADQLAAEGVVAAAFPADVTDERQVTDVVEQVEAKFGPIEVAMHGAAADMADRSASTLATDVASLRVPFALKLYSPMLMARALAPAMIERGRGALLFTSGLSERTPMPYLANFGVALAAQRGYLRQLGAELRDTGVYVGLLDIGALIGDSRAEQLVDAHPELIPPGLELTRIGSAELGERFWRMYTERGELEVEVGFPD